MKYLSISLLFIVIFGINFNGFFENNLLNVLHPDQIIFNNYIVKSVKESSFHFDYVLSLNKNILKVYNPIELFLSRNIYLFLNSNIYLFYRSLFVVNLILYISIFFYIFQKISNKVVMATIFTLFACCNILLGFSADVFGFMSFQNVRSAYYTLPFLALNLYLLIYKKEQLLSFNIYTYSFILNLLLLNLHPVSQIHFSIIFIVFILTEIIRERNVLNYLRIGVLFLFTLLPLFYNLISKPSNIKAQFELKEFMNVMPAYKVHIPTYAITNNFHWIIYLSVSGLFIISFSFFLFIYISKYSKPFVSVVFKIHFALTALLFLLVFNRGQGYFIFSFLVLMLVTIYLSISNSVTQKEFNLLFIFSFSILVSVVGSTILNYLLVVFDFNILILELMRGIRIAYIVILFWTIEVLRHNRYILFYYASIISIFCIVNFNKSTIRVPYYADFQYLEKINNQLNPSSKCFLYLGESYEKSIVEALLLKSISYSNSFYSYDGMNCIYSNKELISPFSDKIDRYKSFFIKNKVVNINSDNVGLIFSLKSNGPINSDNLVLLSQTKFFYIYKNLQ